MKADSLHFNLVAIVSFQIQSPGVQSQKQPKMCPCLNTFGAHGAHGMKTQKENKSLLGE